MYVCVCVYFWLYSTFKSSTTTTKYWILVTTETNYYSNIKTNENTMCCFYWFVDTIFSCGLSLGLNNEMIPMTLFLRNVLRRHFIRFTKLEKQNISAQDVLSKLNYSIFIIQRKQKIFKEATEEQFQHFTHNSLHLRYTIFRID